MGGHTFLHRGEYRPAALAGVRHPAAERRQLWILDERRRRQIQQPGTDHAAPAPHLGHLRGVDVVLVVLGVRQRGGFGVMLAGVFPADAGLVQDGHPLGEGAHHPVFDAVVDHLHEVPGPVRPAVQVALFGLGRCTGAARRARCRRQPRSDRGEQRLEAGHDVTLTSDHQAETAFQPEDPPRGADVDVVDAPAGELGGPVHIVAVVGVAAIEDDVVGFEVFSEREHGLAGDPGGEHHPGRAGDGELRRELRECAGTGRAHGRQLLHRRWVDVVDDAVVPVPHEPAYQVGAHPAKADHPELHEISRSRWTGAVRCQRRPFHCRAAYQP